MICNICGNETTEAGNAFIAIPFGVICEECSNEIEKSKENKTHEELHLAILEDVSNVIAKHLPRFDNNITAETWKLLELFADETIAQLTKEEK